MSDTAPARIFISYSRKDGAGFAATLRKALEAEHFSVWQDIHALEGNRDWWSQIDEALRSKALHHLVLVVTPGALESRVVRQEIRLARQEGKTVSPVKGPGLGDLTKLPRWLGNVYDLDIPARRNVLMRVLEGPSKQNRVPMMAPEPPADFVQRPAEFGALKRKLLDPKGDAVAITAALRGAGGYGKTTLAKALAHDPEIADAYFDGILWVELGEKPNNLLSILSDLVETMTGERPGLENLNAATAKLGEALGGRRILLIIDDAWREQDLRPFLQGGPSTTRLVTTRRDDILPPDAERQPVDAMQGSEALALLAWGLPQDRTAAQKRPLEALSARLGEWAQLLKLVNGFLRDRVLKARQPLDQAIAGVNKRLDEKGLDAFGAGDAADRSDAFSARDAAERSKAVAKTIEVSLDLLSESERARFAELAVFPENVDVPIGIAARLWAKTGGFDEVDTEDLLSRLESLSLLLSLDLNQRTFRFHDTVRHFLQDRAGKEALAALHKTLLQAFEGIETVPGADVASRRYYYLHRPAHLAAAGERGALDALLLDPRWLQAKLDATGIAQALIDDYKQFGQGQVQDLIRRTLRLIAGILARDTRQLLPQLLGRLVDCEGTEEFLQDARRHLPAISILTQHQSLTAPGLLVARLEGAVGYVTVLQELPKGRLASASHDGTIQFWHLDTGTEFARVNGHGAHVHALGVLSNGTLASASDDGTLRFWDLDTGTEIGRIVVGSQVRALAVLSDACIASGSIDGMIHLWEPSTASRIGGIQAHSSRINAMVALADGRLASASDDGTIGLWNLEFEARSERIQAGRVAALAVLPEHHLAFASEADSDGARWTHTVRIRDLKNGIELGSIPNQGHLLAELPNGHLATYSSHETIPYKHIIRVWDARSAAELCSFESEAHYLTSITGLKDGRLVSGSESKRIMLWEPDVVFPQPARRGKPVVGKKGHIGPVHAVALLSGGHLASISEDRSIRVWNTCTCAEIDRFETDLHIDIAYYFVVTPLPGDRLAIFSERDAMVRVWDFKVGEVTERFLLGRQANFQPTTFAVMSDGLVAVGSRGGEVRICDLGQGVETACLKLQKHPIKRLTSLADGRIVAASDAGIIQVCDLNNSRANLQFTGGGNILSLLPFSDSCLVSGSYEGKIQIWDLKTGVETTGLDGHVCMIMGLVKSNGRLVSASYDRTIRLWDINRRVEIARLEVDIPILCLVSLPDGRIVAGDQVGCLHWLEIME